MACRCIDSRDDVLTKTEGTATMADMWLTILMIVAGLAALGVISLVLIAVVSGLRSSAQSFASREDRDDNSGAG